MICLAIETTGRHLGLSFHEFKRDGEPRLLHCYFHEAPARQAEELIPTMDRIMKSKKIAREQLSLIAANVGPGSFTGVRVGLSTARMLAQALDLPLAGVDGLEAIAWPHTRAAHETLFVPVIPAVAGEVYFAAYRGSKTMAEPAWKTEKELAAFLSKNKGAVQLNEPAHPNALAQIAIRRYQSRPRAAVFRYENVEPLYLQPTWAERSKSGG